MAFFSTRLWYLQSVLGRPRKTDFGTGLYFLQIFLSSLSCFLLASGRKMRPSDLGNFPFNVTIISSILEVIPCKSSGLAQLYVIVSNTLNAVLARKGSYHCLHKQAHCIL